jgi:fibronectin type 3 domain-containing protein
LGLLVFLTPIAAHAQVDNTPPSTPQDLTGIPATSTQINLTWSAASDPESGVSFYRVYRDGSVVGSPNQTSFADTGLQPDTRYAYRVSAVNGAGIEGGRSSREAVRTLEEAEDRPPPPTDLVAQVVSSTRIDLTWSHPDPGNVNKYWVYRGSPPQFIAETDDPEYQDTGLTPAVTYEYRVTAVDGNGVESVFSDPASARIPDATPPTIPQNLEAAPVSTSRIDLSWSASSDPESGMGVSGRRSGRNLWKQFVPGHWAHSGNSVRVPRVGGERRRARERSERAGQRPDA